MIEAFADSLFLTIIGGRNGNYPFCHSVQAKRDTESSIINEFWMPVCTGMTNSGTFRHGPSRPWCPLGYIQILKSLSLEKGEVFLSKFQKKKD